MGVERQLLPDRTVDDADDPDLGAAAMEDAIVGESPYKICQNHG